MTGAATQICAFDRSAVNRPTASGQPIPAASQLTEKVARIAAAAA